MPMQEEFVDFTCASLEQQKWVDDHPEQPEGEEADPSCFASTLSNEEYASLLDAAMRFLTSSVPAKPLPMQILALANNAGKANQVSSPQTSVADTHGFQGSPPVRHQLR
ncbi:TPA: hypothetical protein ACH3X1_006052 [Trebouxia sp. C0004]